MTATTLTPERWQPGDVIADLYEVRAVIGAGGMGLVYRVHHAGWTVVGAGAVPAPAVGAKVGQVTAVAATSATATRATPDTAAW